MRDSDGKHSKKGSQKGSDGAGTEMRDHLGVGVRPYTHITINSGTGDAPPIFCSRFKNLYDFTCESQQPEQDQPTSMPFTPVSGSPLHLEISKDFSYTH